MNKFKAAELKDLYQEAAALEDRVDRFAYNNGLSDLVGKPAATAINLLAEAKLKLKEAAMEQAIEDIG